MNESNSMNDPYNLAWERLAFILGFFDRVDTKFSFLFGINIALLGLVGAKTPALNDVTVGGWIALLGFTLCCVYGFMQMYHASAPHLDGGRGSLIYFNSIAQLERLAFHDRFTSQDSATQMTDVLDQIWYNSRILSEKYSRLRKAYRALLASLIPWSIALSLFVT